MNAVLLGGIHDGLTLGIGYYSAPNAIYMPDRSEVSLEGGMNFQIRQLEYVRTEAYSRAGDRVYVLVRPQ